MPDTLSNPVLIETGPKPGWKTTEFWVWVTTMLFTLFQKLGVLKLDESQIAAVIANLAPVISGAVYMLSRAHVKANAPTMTGVQVDPEPLAGTNPIAPLLLLVLATALAMGGCSLPQQTATVAKFNADAAARAAVSYAGDTVLLRSAIASHLAGVRAVHCGDIHREIIIHGYVGNDGAANLHALELDIGKPDTSTALVREVRTGRMSAVQAGQWLTDYAAYSHASNALDLQDVLVGQLADIQAFDASSADVLASLDAHFADVNALLREVNAGNEAIVEFIAGQNKVDWQSAGASLGPVAVDTLASKIKDPAKRAAAVDLFGAVFKTLPLPK